jgi:signal transduction histidine kinase
MFRANRVILRRRFQLQLLFALVAAASVTALVLDLAVSTVQHAGRFVVSDTNRTLGQAIRELKHGYPDLAAADARLRGISQTVLNSFPGVEGGYWTRASQFAGYSYPTHDGGAPKVDVPAAEKSSIESVIAESIRNGTSQRVLRGRHDLVVIAAESTGGVTAWAMKRLPGQAEPVRLGSNVLLGVLVAAAFLGAAGVLATAIGLRRGVAEMKSGLAMLRTDFTRRLPERPDELGEIGAAINEMAVARTRLEEQVRREDRARTVGHLVGRIAHELRNPLNSIRLSLQMLAQRQSEQRLRPGDFRIVVDEVDRMNRLLSDLLTFQQARQPELEPRQIAPILAECIQALGPQARERGVGLVAPATLAGSALMDERQFRQIAVNLVMNAIDASRRGQEIQIQTKSAGGWVAIEVSDQGDGLTSQQREHLFEPFFTTKADGHGLGLAVSRELARGMGANLVYRSERQGTTFILEMPEAHGTERNDTDRRG